MQMCIKPQNTQPLRRRRAPSMYWYGKNNRYWQANCCCRRRWLCCIYKSKRNISTCIEQSRFLWWWTETDSRLRIAHHQQRYSWLTDHIRMSYAVGTERAANNPDQHYQYNLRFYSLQKSLTKVEVEYLGVTTLHTVLCVTYNVSTETNGEEVLLVVLCFLSIHYSVLLFLAWSWSASARLSSLSS